jgi:hypothetical protein
METAAAFGEALIGVVRTTSAERNNMSAAVLKRKLRNFPAGNLSLRVVGS